VESSLRALNSWLDLLASRAHIPAIVLYRRWEALRFAQGFPFVQVQDQDQLFAGVDVADAITLIVEAAREVKFIQPPSLH